MLEGFNGVIELSTELKARVLDWCLSFDHDFLVLSRSHAVLLREEGLVRAAQIPFEYPEISQVANDEEVLCIDFKHVQHVASSSVNGIDKHDCVAPSFLEFEVVAVNQYFKFTWPTRDRDVAVGEQQHARDLERQFFCVNYLAPHSLRVVHYVVDLIVVLQQNQSHVATAGI